MCIRTTPYIMFVYLFTVYDADGHRSDVGPNHSAHRSHRLLPLHNRTLQRHRQVQDCILLVLSAGGDSDANSEFINLFIYSLMWCSIPADIMQHLVVLLWTKIRRCMAENRSINYCHINKDFLDLRGLHTQLILIFFQNG